MADAASQLAVLARSVWQLELTRLEREPEFPTTGTCFGGMPYMRIGEEWPMCTGCGNALDFVCQLRLPDGFPLPAAVVVFYYCFECNPLGDAEDEGQWQLRRYKKATETDWLPQSKPDEQVTLPCSVEVEEKTLVPDWHGLRFYLPGLYEELLEKNQNSHDDASEAYEALLDEMLEDTSFTFVNGYPQWIDEDDTPACPRCSESMELLAQIDSEDAADLIWGNSGCAYLFYCDQHTKEISLRIQF